MPRFVLVHHECPPGYIKPSHYDFMLEFSGVLKTWELRKLPNAWCGGETAADEVLLATRLADHRIEYLDYEGPVSGDRGTVSRVATGIFHAIATDDEHIIVELDSSMYRGAVQLTATSQRGHWQLELRAN
jgi:hypothetical protein